jgi:hypothetical protein
MPRFETIEKNAFSVAFLFNTFFACIFCNFFIGFEISINSAFLIPYCIFVNKFFLCS